MLEELNSLGLNTSVCASAGRTASSGSVRNIRTLPSIEHGKLDPLHAKYGITPETAIEKLRPYLKIHQPQTL